MRKRKTNVEDRWPEIDRLSKWYDNTITVGGSDTRVWATRLDDLHALQRLIDRNLLRRDQSLKEWKAIVAEMQSLGGSCWSPMGIQERKEKGYIGRVMVCSKDNPYDSWGISVIWIEDSPLQRLKFAPSKDLPLLIGTFPPDSEEAKLLEARLSGKKQEIPKRPDLLKRYEKYELRRDRIYGQLGRCHLTIIAYLKKRYYNPNLPSNLPDVKRIYQISIDGHDYAYLFNGSWWSSDLSNFFSGGDVIKETYL